MSKTSLPEDRIPVIVGVGEIVDRPKDIAAGLEPLALLEEALKRAEADSGAKLLGDIQIRYLHEAAQRIARGECSVAAVCGAEAQSTATKAERTGIKLPWTPFA